MWLEHPRYIPIRDALIESLRSSHYRFRGLERVLFLCGGASSPRRDALRDYLHKHAPWLNLFYAERAWEQIASQADWDALKMEADLAALADLVIIVVESPGTFAELGAFSLSDPLRKKLLPIVDIEYRGVPSFISTGPLKWIDAESNFAPTIYVSLSRILKAIDQVEERITRIPRTRAVRLSDLAMSPRHLLFFLCDLIAVIYPATVDMVEFYLGQIAPSIPSSKVSIPTLIALAVAMELLRAKDVMVGDRKQKFLWPASPNAVERPFHRTRRLLDLPSQRAAHVSVLLSVPEAKHVLHELRSVS
jgi:hypothetical protein